MHNQKISRETILDDVKKIKSSHILCELPTGTGKSKVALDYIHFKNIQGKILIVIPRLILINNWKEEFKKWGYEKYLQNVEFTTYISVLKYSGQTFDAVIYDEAHHLSDRALSGVETIKSDYSFLLSATVPKALKETLKQMWPDLYTYSLQMRQAIENEILPDPKVLLIPLSLDNKQVTEKYTMNTKSKNKPVEISYKDRFAAAKAKLNCIVNCTQQQYYDNISYWVDRYKSLYLRTGNKRYYYVWQQKALERLKYLSGLKNNLVLNILNLLDKYRTLTFCNSIEQTKQLGKYCINSENKDSFVNLDKFNNHEINHITACNMVNEGCNLVDCQIGIFVAINSSEIMVKQKNGRILRHKKPIIIIPYYVKTREEELVQKMLLNYNPSLIININDLKDIKEKIK